MNATIVITTKNRKEDLRKALKSALEQTGAPQVLIIDDGSTDGTSEMVRIEFPRATVVHAEVSCGYIVQRNRAAELATGDVIISIDDDAAFSTSGVVEQTLAEFTDPRVGAVAMPYSNVTMENELLQRSPGESGTYVTYSFVGTAHAVRRDLFIQLGGYRTYLFHQGEEQDLCIRMFDRGYVVRLGRADPIFHYESPLRDFRRRDLYGRRNDLLFVWYNVPWPDFPKYLVGTLLLGVKFGLKARRPFWMLQGIAMGFRGIFHEWSRRKPVSLQAFRSIRLLKQSPMPLAQMEDLIPAVR